MTAEIKKEFSVTITCNEEEAKLICDTLHIAYKPMKHEYGYCDDKATALRVARNAFAGVINRSYMGEDA